MTEQMNTVGSKLKGILEAVLFMSEKPLSLERLCEIASEATQEEILEAIAQIKETRSFEGFGIELTEVANGYQLRTKQDLSPWIFKLNKARPVRLSRAALETLSIVAYRQPVTRPEVDDIRGVDCGPVLRNLMERNLVKILGKREEPGNPLIYGTTKEFLEFFALKNLSDLPTLREYTELGDESRAKLEELLPPTLNETSEIHDQPEEQLRTEETVPQA